MLMHRLRIVLTLSCMPKNTTLGICQKKSSKTALKELHLPVRQLLMRTDANAKLQIYAYPDLQGTDSSV